MIEPEEIIYSKRKTLCLQVTSQGKFIVRAPKRTSPKFINDFIQKKQLWVQKTLQKITEKLAKNNHFRLTEEEVLKYKKKARVELQKRLEELSTETGLKYTKFRLSSAKTRWGSCSSKDVISLNWRLVFMPPEVIDYVVIHELAHTKEKNHSKNFWDLVAIYDPGFRVNRKKLKELSLTYINS